MYRKTYLAIALVLVILLAGTTMTAYAAQGALPGDALYALKTAFEDIRLNATWDTAGEAERSMQYADRRMQEIEALVSRSRYEDVPVGVARFEGHLQEALDALNIVAQNDPQLAEALATLLVNLLNEQSQLLVALLEANPGIDPAALQEALAASRASISSLNGVTGLVDNANANANDNGAEVNANISANFNANDNGDDNGFDDNGVDDNANDNSFDDNGVDANANDNGDDNGIDDNSNDNGMDDNGADDNSNDNGMDDNGADDNSNDNGDDNGSDDGLNGGSNANENGDDNGGSGSNKGRGGDDNDNQDDKGRDGNENGANLFKVGLIQPAIFVI